MFSDTDILCHVYTGKLHHEFDHLHPFFLGEGIGWTKGEQDEWRDFRNFDTFLPWPMKFD